MLYIDIFSMIYKVVFKSWLVADIRRKFFYEATFKIFQIKKSGHINKQIDIKISPAFHLNICNILYVMIFHP